MTISGTCFDRDFGCRLSDTIYLCTDHSAMHDIRDRSDIELLVNRFYDKVKQDELIAFFFSEIIPVDWPAHLPRMYDFWETIVFGTAKYKGEPMTAHILLSKKHRMEPEHFGRWLKLFRETVDENFSGEKAEEIKTRAESIARIMEMKVS